MIPGLSHNPEFMTTMNPANREEGENPAGKSRFHSLDRNVKQFVLILIRSVDLKVK